MADDRDEDALVDLFITSWEQQCINQMDEEADIGEILTSEKDLVSRNIWCSFQNTATAIAQLYKDRVQDAASLWGPFQAAAGAVTTMFKDCGDGVRRVNDVGVQYGYQRRNKELLQWVKKKRRNIRREDLIAYLAGKPPPRHQGHQRTSQRARVTFGPTSLYHQSASPSLSTSHYHASEIGSAEDNLKIFGEALAINTRETLRRHRPSELNSFFTTEYARHCLKRAASSSPPRDVNMDSPTHKRTKHF